MWANCGYLFCGANCTQSGQIVRAYIIKAKRMLSVFGCSGVGCWVLGAGCSGVWCSGVGCWFSGAAYMGQLHRQARTHPSSRVGRQVDSTMIFKKNFSNVQKIHIYKCCWLFAVLRSEGLQRANNMGAHNL